MRRKIFLAKFLLLLSLLMFQYSMLYNRGQKENGFSLKEEESNAAGFIT